MSQPTFFCFTLNNPVGMIDWKVDDAKKIIAYAIYQAEMSESGTYHYQGYVETKRNQRLAALKKILPKAHWEEKHEMSTRDQARAYCTPQKNGEPGTIDPTYLEGPWEYGVWKPIRESGTRTDLVRFRDRVKEQASLRDIADEMPAQFILFQRGLSALKQVYQNKRTWKTETVLILGRPGEGKTKYVYDKHGFDGVYEKPCSKWWDGYDSNEVVLMDDFNGYITYRELLSVTDRYPAKVEFKGGYCQFLGKILYLVSNRHPSQWYSFEVQNRNDISALYRRFSKVLACENDQFIEYPTLTAWEEAGHTLTGWPPVSHEMDDPNMYMRSYDEE